MTFWSIGADVAAGWCFWSLVHNLGHRWWHVEMRLGTRTPYAHGEREHHRIYDSHDDHALHAEKDPNELFISFPFIVIAPAALIFVALFGYWRGWSHAIPFLVGLHGSMAIDHFLHRLFHRAERLSGLLGWFQKMHQIHHRTHRNNFFFVSGLPWDLLLGTARTQFNATRPVLLEPAIRLERKSRKKISTMAP